MELKEVKEISKKHRKYKECLSKYGTLPFHFTISMDDRITELEKALRELLRVSGYNGSLQEYSKARESALKILAKGDI